MEKEKCGEVESKQDREIERKIENGKIEEKERQREKKLRNGGRERKIG